MGYADGLSVIIKRLKPKRSLEIGFGYEGFSSHVFLTDSDTKLTSLYKSDWIGNVAKRTEEHPERLTFLEGFSQNVVPQIKGKFDFIYIDGDHNYDGVYTDISNCMKLCKVGGVILIDDYGVKFGAVDVVEGGRIVDGYYGVAEATDKLLTNNEKWERYGTDIDFGNGAVAFKRLK